jgi:hypothetical protein
MKEKPSIADPEPAADAAAEEADRAGGKPTYVKVHDARPDDYDGTCLRPLGLCELGGCCETCWYRPDHPRFQQGAADEG